MSTIGYATLQVIPSMKGVQGALTREMAGADSAAASAGDRTGKRFAGGVGRALKKGAGLFAGFFAVQKLTGFLGGTISEASDLGETMNKASVIFGKSIGAISTFGDTAAKKLGLSKEAAVAFAANFGDMFSQLGFTQKAATDMSKATVQMSADLGSFNNLPTGDVAQRISAAFRGEYDSLQALIPNINAARVEQEAMSETGKKNAKSLTAQEKAAAVLAIVNKDGARAQGDFARTSGGLANQQKILSAQTKDLQAKMGSVLVPALAKAASMLNAKLFPALAVVGASIVSTTGFLQDNSGAVKIIAAIIGTILLPQIIRWGIQSSIAAAKSVAAWVTSKASAVSSVLFQSVGLTLIGLGWISVGIQAALGAARTAAAWVLSKLGVAGTIALYGVAFAMMAAGWIASGVAALAGAAAMAAAWLISILPIVLVVALISGIVFLIIKYWDTIKAKTAAIWGAIRSGIVNIVSAIAGFIRVNFDRIRAFISSVWNAIKGAASAAWNGIKNTVNRGVTALVSGVQAIPGKLMGLASKFGSAGRSLIGAFVDGLKNAGGVIKGIAGNVWNAVKGLLNRAISQINARLEFKINLPLGKSIGINPPDIPQLAEGGVVNRATLAMIGEGSEPEAVLPLSKLATLLEGAQASRPQSGPGNVFHVYQQPDESTDELAERLWFKQRARG